MLLNPYLNFDGRCETAFKLYQQILGGKITFMMPFEGSPLEHEVPIEWRKKILHARLLIGDEVLMGGDEMPEDYHAPEGFNVTLGFSDPADAERIFSALAKDGKVRMPLQETFWAVRFGLVTDQFGIPWMINCEKSS
jgi:PhnB protein